LSARRVLFPPAGRQLVQNKSAVYMKMCSIRSQKSRSKNAAFSIIEATVGAGVFGVIFCAFCSALTSSFSVVGSARETLRATEIMAEKMDTLRLYDWSDLTNSGYMP